jgi:glycosyltransferase involved in cell wall biosynthesis
LNKNVLIINQSAELYGADKAILELIENFPFGYTPIVVLHEEGPLKDLLENLNIQVIKTSVIKVKRGILKPAFFLKLPFEILQSIYKIKKELKGKKIDLVHSNATSVFIGAFYSSVFRIPHLWHVHEIIEKPERIAKIYPRIVNFFSNKVVFNSKATEKHFIGLFPKISKKGIVVYNGLKRKIPYLTQEEIINFKQTHFNSNSSDKIITIIGRISEIKGQKIAVSALKKIVNEFTNVKLIIIGSYVTGKNQYYIELLNMIDSYKLKQKVEFIDFKEDIWPYYDASDIILMPSTEPESFGLVAAEGLLSKKNVIASNIGALPEIIIHEKTGLLFEPNDAEDLANKIVFLLRNDDINYGELGKNHVYNNFNTTQLKESFEKIYVALAR